MSSPAVPGTPVPGTPIHHVAAATRRYVGCPSIVVLPSGSYIASHSYFGHGATNTDSFVYRSDDRGATWRRIAEIHQQMWSKLFLHGNALYIVGTDHCDRYGGRLNGRMVIRRSGDEGVTWSRADSARTGWLSDEEGYHTAPTPLVVHEGRIWKAFEFAPEPDRRTWRVFVISAPVDADLLDRASWRFSRQLETWPDYQWIEGNMVVAPGGELVDVLRTNDRNHREGHGVDEPAAIVHVAADGLTLTHDPVADRVTFPGGGAKFTIKRDPVGALPGAGESAGRAGPVPQHPVAVGVRGSALLERGRGADPASGPEGPRLPVRRLGLRRRRHRVRLAHRLRRRCHRAKPRTRCQLPDIPPYRAVSPYPDPRMSVGATV